MNLIQPQAETPVLQDITPAGKLSQKEALKCARDATIATLAVLIPQLIQYATVTDWGEYGQIASIVLAIVGVFANRFFNIYRIK
jgi:hypothetical protein